MKKSNKILEKACGSGAREVYLEKHPHGFYAINKVHKNAKKYNRKQKYSWE